MKAAKVFLWVLLIPASAGLFILRIENDETTAFSWSLILAVSNLLLLTGSPGWMITAGLKRLRFMHIVVIGLMCWLAYTSTAENVVMMRTFKTVCAFVSAVGLAVFSSPASIRGTNSSKQGERGG